MTNEVREQKIKKVEFISKLDSKRRFVIPRHERKMCKVNERDYVTFSVRRILSFNEDGTITIDAHKEVFPQLIKKGFRISVDPAIIARFDLKDGSIIYIQIEKVTKKGSF